MFPYRRLEAVFCVAVETGRLALAKAFVARYPPMSTGEKRGQAATAATETKLSGTPCHGEAAYRPRWLAHCCATGDLVTAKWLTSYFGLTAKDARGRENFAFIETCGHGYLDAAKWLVEHFGLSSQDARSRGKAALWRSCIGGHLAVAEWLAARFNFTPEEVKCPRFTAGARRSETREGSLLEATYNHGKIEAANWLAERFYSEDEVFRFCPVLYGTRRASMLWALLFFWVFSQLLVVAGMTMWRRLF
jgi:hypothetical protein